MFRFICISFIFPYVCINNYYVLTYEIICVCLCVCVRACVYVPNYVCLCAGLGTFVFMCVSVQHFFYSVLKKPFLNYLLFFYRSAITRKRYATTFVVF